MNGKPSARSRLRHPARSDKLRTYLDSLGDDIPQAPPVAFLDLRELAQRVGDFLAAGGAVADLVVEVQDWKVSEDVCNAVAALDGLGIGRANVWALLALWAATRDTAARDASLESRLTVHVAEICEEDRRTAWGVFALAFNSRQIAGAAVRAVPTR